MITVAEVQAAIPDFREQQLFVIDLLRRGEGVIREEPLPNITTKSLSREITLNIQRGSEQNHTNYLMQEIENGIEIVERALDRARLLLRARPEIYGDAEADKAAKDIIAHQNIAQNFLAQFHTLSEEQLKRLETAQPEDPNRLPQLQQRAADARHDFERVTDYILKAASAGATQGAQEEAEYFAYVRPLPANVREAYVDGSLDLAKLFTRAVEYTSRRMDSLLDLLDLNRMGFLALEIIPEEEALEKRVALLNEYRIAKEDVQKMLDIAKGYFTEALNFASP